MTGVDLTVHDGVKERVDRFVQADLDQGLPPELDGPYDVVLAADVLEHVRRPDALLAQLHDVLAPGGSLIVSVPNFGHWYPRIRVALGRFDYDRRGILDADHVRFFTRRSFERLVTAEGFTVARRDATGLPLEVADRGGHGQEVETSAVSRRDRPSRSRRRQRATAAVRLPVPLRAASHPRPATRSEPRVSFAPPRDPDAEATDRDDPARPADTSVGTGGTAGTHGRPTTLVAGASSTRGPPLLRRAGSHHGGRPGDPGLVRPDQAVVGGARDRRRVLVPLPGEAGRRRTRLPHPFDFYKDGVVAPGADHPPGFVLVLAFLDRLGIDTPQGQRLAMCVLGTATIAVIAVLGRRLGGARVGLIAAGIAAVYPNFWINDGMLMVETLVHLRHRGRHCWPATATCTAPTAGTSSCSPSRSTVAAMPGPRRSCCSGLLVLPLVLFRREHPWRERFTQLVVAAAIPVLAFAPWVAVQPQPLRRSRCSSAPGAGQTLAVGNCDLTFGGRTSASTTPVACALRRSSRRPPPTVRCVTASTRRIARDYIDAHRADLPRVVAARVGRVWQMYQVDQSIGLDGYIEGRAGGPPTVTSVWCERRSGATSCWCCWRSWAVVILRRRRETLYPLLVQPLLATFTAATTFGITRYRAGAEVVDRAAALRSTLGAVVRAPVPDRYRRPRRLRRAMPR